MRSFGSFARVTLPAATALALLGGGLAQAVPAHADFSWCFDDPVVSINGHLVDIRFGEPLQNLLSMRSTAITVVIPQNVSGSVVLNDVSAFPMTTTISRTGPAWSGKGGIPVTVNGTVTAGTSFQVEMMAIPLVNLTNLLDLNSLLHIASATGTTNHPFSMSFSLS